MNNLRVAVGAAVVIIAANIFITTVGEMRNKTFYREFDTRFRDRKVVFRS